MNFYAYWISNPIIEALGWTILHSMWQGGLISIVLALALIGLRRNSSKVRYFVSITGLSMILLISVVTFLNIYNSLPASISQEDAGLVEIVAGPTSAVLAPGVTVMEGTFWEQISAFFTNYFRQHLPFIVFVWGLGVLILTLRFLGAIAYLQRLKYYKTQMANDYWQGTVRYLATKLKIKKAVRLLESAQVQIPMVIGHLKPVILLPLGTLTGLSPAQIESILAHELAHIQRHDYLVNILQALVEILLFFNPFVWWVSNQVRDERENCCDDIAVELTGDHVALVRTLAALEELRISNPKMAMSLAGQKGGMVSRIRRLVYLKNRNASFSEGFAFALLLMGCIGLVSFHARTDYAWNEQSDKVEVVEEVPIVSEVEAPKAPKALKKVISILGDNHDLSLSEIVGNAVEIAEDINGVLQKVKGDTIRFKGYVIITDERGDIDIFKDGEKIPEEEYENYSEDFKINDSKLRLAPNTDNEISILLEDHSRERSDYSLVIPNIKIDGKSIFIPELPPLPALPPLPVFPHLNLNFDFDDDYDFDFDDDFDDYDFDFDKGDIRIHIDDNSLNEEQREALEKYKQEMKEWQEELEESIGSLRKNHHEYTQKYAEEIHGNYKKQIKAYQEKTKAYAKRIKKVHAEKRAKLKAAFIEDGLLDKDATRLNIRVRNQKIKVNGDEIPKSLYPKYKKLFKDLYNININDRDSDWSWSWSESEH